MSEIRTADEPLVAFLLGEMPAEQRAHIEDRLVGDDPLFDELRAVEDDLIDAYVRDELPPERRRRFEDRLLVTPEQRARVEFARTLRQVIDHHQTSSGRSGVLPLWRSLVSWESRVPRVVVAATISALLLGAAWLTLENFGLRDQLAEVELAHQAERSATERQQSELERTITRERAASRDLAAELDRQHAAASQLERQVAELAKKQAPARVRQAVSFVLALDVTRGATEEATAFAVPAGADSVHLQVDLGAAAGYPTYRALLRTHDGTEVWSQDGLAAHATPAGPTVDLELPAGVLASGDHELILLGLDDDGSFKHLGSRPFRVTRRPASPG